MNIEMNEDVRVKWVEALESGKYKQAKGTLAELDADGNVIGHCCLGVLCELAVEEGVIPAPLIDRRVSPKPLYGRDHDQDISLPLEVMEWAGLETDEVQLKTRDTTYDSVVITGVNDSGATFAEIAEIIKLTDKV